MGIGVAAGWISERIKLSKEQKVQECDATKMSREQEAGNKKYKQQIINVS